MGSVPSCNRGQPVEPGKLTPYPVNWDQLNDELSDRLTPAGRSPEGNPIEREFSLAPPKVFRRSQSCP